MVEEDHGFLVHH